MKKHRERRPSSKSIESSKATFVEALAIHLQKKAARRFPESKYSTLLKEGIYRVTEKLTWLGEKEIGKITATECKEWRAAERCLGQYRGVFPIVGRSQVH